MPLLDLDLYRTEVPVSIEPRVRLSVIDAGPRDAEHTLLFIHGFGGKVAQWEKQLATFAEKYRVVATDVRGHGLSDHPDSLYSVQELVNDLERIVEHLNLLKKIVVIGHSFGGAIATTFTIRHPTRVEKLILIGTAINFKLGIAQDTLSKLPTQYAEPLRGLLPTALNAPLSVMKKMYLNAVEHWDGTDVFPQLHVPTLVILGVRDLVYDQARYDAVADLVPNVQLAKIPVSAHMVQLERAEAVNRAIQRFIGSESVSWREGRRAANAQLLAARPWLQHYEDGVPNTLSYPSQPLFRFLDTAARRFPHRPAVVFYGSSLSYRDLKRAANRFANALRSIGVKPGDRVALLLPTCPQFVIAYFGGLKAGAVVVSLNPQLGAGELVHHLNDSGAEIMIALDESYALIQQLKPQTHIQTILLADLTAYMSPLRRAMLAVTRRLPYADRRTLTKSKGVFDFEDMVAQASKEAPLIDITSDDLALIQYSTGTTDLPKGVMLTHANLVANTVQLRHWMPDVTEGEEKVLSVLPLSHSYAMTTCMNFAIAIAAAMILLPRVNTGELLETIAHERPTIFPGTPSIYVTINQFPNVRRFGLRTIRACLSGAAPLPLEVQEAFEKVTRGKLVEGYGLTEASPVTHANPIFGESKSGTVGIPLPGTVAKIVDRETGWEIAAGEIGELIVRGPQVMRGYWNNPAQTARALRDGWLYTGDMVREDEDGYLQFVDRKSDLIEKDGMTIYPRDIEEMLYEHPQVVEAAVVGLKRNEGNPLIKAYVVLRKNAKATPEEIIAFARARLPAGSVPDAVEFRASLPKTLVGKVFKRKLIEEEQQTRFLPSS